LHQSCETASIRLPYSASKEITLCIISVSVAEWTVIRIRTYLPLGHVTFRHAELREFVRETKTRSNSNKAVRWTLTSTSNHRSRWLSYSDATHRLARHTATVALLSLTSVCGTRLSLNQPWILGLRVYTCSPWNSWVCGYMPILSIESCKILDNKFDRLREGSVGRVGLLPCNGYRYTAGRVRVG